VFVRLDWKNLANDKHSSLLQKSVIYGQKKFYNIGPTTFSITTLNLMTFSITIKIMSLSIKTLSIMALLLC
jgi:hypothetical protein